MIREHFDADYYARYYEDPETAIVTPEMRRAEIAFVLSFCAYIGVQIRRFADVGAGTGWWTKEFRRQHPACRSIETFDASEAACRLYGHRKVPLQRLRGSPADLVVCRDVLRYLDNTEAEEGITRLAKKCRGVLYVHLVTTEDEYDEDASDLAGYFRSASWYRTRLRKAGFADCGMGLFVSRRYSEFRPWAIEVR